jgi:hypothetical protein
LFGTRLTIESRTRAIGVFGFEPEDRAAAEYAALIFDPARARS